MRVRSAIWLIQRDGVSVLVSNLSRRNVELAIVVEAPRTTFLDLLLDCVVEIKSLGGLFRGSLFSFTLVHRYDGLEDEG